MNTKDFAELVRAFHQQVRSAIAMGDSRRSGGQATNCPGPFELLQSQDRRELLDITDALVLGVEAMEREMTAAHDEALEKAATLCDAVDYELSASITGQAHAERIRALKSQPVERMVPMSKVLEAIKAERDLWLAGVANAGNTGRMKTAGLLALDDLKERIRGES